MTAPPSPKPETPALLPCPFCGSRRLSKIHVFRPEDLDMDGSPHFYVMCMGCRARGGEGDPEGVAFDVWNRRAELAAFKAAPSARDAALDECEHVCQGILDELSANAIATDSDWMKGLYMERSRGASLAQERIRALKGKPL